MHPVAVLCSVPSDPQCSWRWLYNLVILVVTDDCLVCVTPPVSPSEEPALDPVTFLLTPWPCIDMMTLRWAQLPSSCPLTPSEPNSPPPTHVSSHLPHCLQFRSLSMVSECLRKKSETEDLCGWVTEDTVVANLGDVVSICLGFVKIWFGPIATGSGFTIGFYQESNCIKQFGVAPSNNVKPRVSWF